MNIDEYKEKLSTYRYHWLWGMTASESSYLCRYDNEISLLNAYPQTFEPLKKQHMDISRYNPIRRFFYRLFNINKCNDHFYQLCAYVTYHQIRTGNAETENVDSLPVFNLFSSSWQRMLSYFSFDDSLLDEQYLKDFNEREQEQDEEQDATRTSSTNDLQPEDEETRRAEEGYAAVERRIAEYNEKTEARLRILEENIANLKSQERRHNGLDTEKRPELPSTSSAFFRPESPLKPEDGNGESPSIGSPS